ncbi:ectoine/hydroxyectoine ABC transporter permease subunit EhuC [Paenibacillus sp. 598K]|uniref:ectoine/hydroxyectoine ABC transporter permease subunit EhuC n=1 Tax=Paenibacillus sp. 598K TaxID=1117987 RepID=UPI000FF90A98|nr:ectoine/hydroxyectoine ABC transporter permease subunit EhuC [Paenibacillus sp. 598K]GBF73345.1 ectoine/hydroxyectoine ABC transporter permease subunit EhuC [Paenibacillus sp. 598K]
MFDYWLQWMPLLWKGLVTTVEVTAYSAVLALLLAVLTGICRVSRFRVIRGLALLYVLTFRGIALLVLLFWIYYVLPYMDIELSKTMAAVLALGLNYGAFGSEIVRSSILAVPQGQWEAAKALNMRPFERMFRIIFPQALIRMIPPFNNLMIELLKASSLLYFIGLADLVHQSNVLRGLYLQQTTQIYLTLLIIYFILASIISYAFRLLERRWSAGRL